MKKSKKTLTIKLEVVPASGCEVFANWINPKTPGNPWYEGDKLLFSPRSTDSSIGLSVVHLTMDDSQK